jgi:hypothetical protein
MKPGSLIECINDTFNPEQLTKIPNRPKCGQYYIVREIHDFSGKVGILLEEITNPEIPLSSGGWIEPSFNIERFREIEGIPDIAALLEDVLLELN